MKIAKREIRVEDGMKKLLNEMRINFDSFFLRNRNEMQNETEREREGEQAK